MDKRFTICLKANDSSLSRNESTRLASLQTERLAFTREELKSSQLAADDLENQQTNLQLPKGLPQRIEDLAIE